MASREQTKRRARERALEFWRTTSQNEWLCNRCNDSIPRDEGYLCSPQITGVHSLDTGGSLDLSGCPDLICDACFESDAEASPFEGAIRPPLQDALGQHDAGALKSKRPTSITVICVLGFIGAAFSIPLIFSDVARQLGSWYPPFLGLMSALGLACMIGLWKMKKWAAYTYTGMVALNQIVLLATGLWNIFAILLPAIVIFFALRNVSRMT